MSALHPLSAVVLPVALAALSGALFARWRPGSLAALNEAVFYIFVPALIYHTAATTELGLQAILAVSGAALCVTLSIGVGAQLWFRWRGVDSRGLVVASALPNNANMGMSLCLFAFGAEGLAFATAFYAATVLVTFSVGLPYLAGRTGGYREIFRVPVLYALGAGVLVHALELEPPEAFNRAAALLGQAAVPCALVSLGHRLMSYPLRDQGIRSLRLAAEATVLRVGGGLLIALIYTTCVSMEEVTRQVALVQSSMPSAVMTTVMAERYGQDPQLVATTVAVSTLTSLALLPVLFSQLL